MLMNQRAVQEDRVHRHQAGWSTPHHAQALPWSDLQRPCRCWPCLWSVCSTCECCAWALSCFPPGDCVIINSSSRSGARHNSSDRYRLRYWTIACLDAYTALGGDEQEHRTTSAAATAVLHTACSAAPPVLTMPAPPPDVVPMLPCRLSSQIPGPTLSWAQRASSRACCQAPCAPTR